VFKPVNIFSGGYQILNRCGKFILSLDRRGQFDSCGALRYQSLESDGNQSRRLSSPFFVSSHS